MINSGMVVDNLSNQVVTATGVAKELAGAERDYFQELYLPRNPYFKDFIFSPTCALLKVEVETYYVVSRFQNVTELHIRK